MANQRIQTRELEFSLTEDEMDLELGIPFNPTEQPASGDPESKISDDPAPARKRKGSRIARLLRVRSRKAQRKHEQETVKATEATAPPPAETVASPAPATAPPAGPADLPPAGQDWQLKPTTRMLQGPLRDGVLKPVLHLFCKLHILGAEHLKGLRGPIIVASNHTSHFDTPVIWEILPREIRKKMATAAAADHWFKNKMKGLLPGIAYGAIPFPRKGSLGLKHCIELIQLGWSVLIFPEGTRSNTGGMSGFKPGIGRMATATRAPIIPIHLRGLHRILPKTRSLPKRGNVWIAVGPPIFPGLEEPVEEITRRIEESVRYLGTLLDPYDDGISEEEFEGPPGLY